MCFPNACTSNQTGFFLKCSDSWSSELLLKDALIFSTFASMPALRSSLLPSHLSKRASMANQRRFRRSSLFLHVVPLLPFHDWSWEWNNSLMGRVLSPSMSEMPWSHSSHMYSVEHSTCNHAQIVRHKICVCYCKIVLWYLLSWRMTKAKYAMQNLDSLNV